MGEDKYREQLLGLWGEFNELWRRGNQFQDNGLWFRHAVDNFIDRCPQLGEKNKQIADLESKLALIAKIEETVVGENYIIG